jgi:hypothetical protein
MRQNGSENGKRVLLLAARQPELTALLEDAGFEVDARRRPLDGEPPEADVAVVFRGRFIGRNQAPALSARGIPVVEVLSSQPTSASTGQWLRLSNRIHKSDLVQIIRSLADRAE